MNGALPTYNHATGLPTYTEAMKKDSATNKSYEPNRVASSLAAIGNKGSQASRGMAFMGGLTSSQPTPRK